MLTGSIVISGPSSIMEPTVPGTTANAHVSISLAMYSYGDSGTVQWATQPVANGATPGEDYDTSSGTVSLSYLNAQVYVDIPIKYDTLSEPSEAFQVVLSNPTGNLGIMQGTLTISITDNSPPPPPPPQYPLVATVNFSDSGSHHIFEGDEREIHVVRDLSYGELIVYYVIADDSVASEDDVTLEPAGSVTFAPGQTEATIRLTAEDDSTIEVHELLKLSLVTYPAPNQGPGAYLVGSAADSFTTINDNNEVIFSDLTVDWKTPDGGWQNSPDTEMLWQDDQLRWTVTLPPEEVPFRNELTNLKLLRRPHDTPTAGWEEIATQSFEQNPNNQTQLYIYANPVVGDWDITVHGSFGLGVNAWLVAPKNRAVDAIVSTVWKKGPNDPDQRLGYFSNPYLNPGPAVGIEYFGPIIFPEYTLPPDHVQDQNDHQTVSVEVTLAMAPKGFTTNVIVKAFDPDHSFNPSDPGETLSLDRNDEFSSSGNPPLSTLVRKPNDNRPVNIGGHFAVDAIPFSNTETVKSTTFRIGEIQPGNNFRVVALGRRDNLALVEFAPDGVTLLEFDCGCPLNPGNVTEVLTVWRTLHIEPDSMGAPDATDMALQDHFADPANDDPHPGNVPDARLGLLAEKFAPANVAVVADLGDYDVKEDFTFQRNSDIERVKQPNGAEYVAAKDVRDVKNDRKFWAIQVNGAYEFDEDQDYDENGTPGVWGFAAFGTPAGSGEPVVFIFLETVRDLALNAPPLRLPATGELRNQVGRTELEKRAVVHEVGHTFLVRHHTADQQDWSNQGIMSYNMTNYGTDAEFQFTIKQLGRIQDTTKPHGG